MKSERAISFHSRAAALTAKIVRRRRDAGQDKHVSRSSASRTLSELDEQNDGDSAGHCCVIASRQLAGRRTNRAQRRTKRARSQLFSPLPGGQKSSARRALLMMRASADNIIVSRALAGQITRAPGAARQRYITIKEGLPARCVPVRRKHMHLHGQVRRWNVS